MTTADRTATTGRPTAPTPPPEPRNRSWSTRHRSRATGSRPATGPAVDAALRTAVDDRWATRIWERDTKVWTDDVDVAIKIAARLGWLDAPAHFRPVTDDLRAFADGLHEAGFDRALVCGMGGSSLAPEVLGLAYPMGDGAHAGRRPRLDRSRRRSRWRPSTFSPETSCYIIATKSGTTAETLAFLAHFWALEHAGHHDIGDKDEGDHFVAVTDPDASVEAIPHSDSFRAVFLNPPDIGGRYSALTYVGLAPAALLGLDLDALLDEAARMAAACRGTDAGNPGIVLGATLGALAGRGRDKLTLVIEPALESFGNWVEQLIAESTGKDGHGIVPVVGEPLAQPGGLRRRSRLRPHLASGVDAPGERAPTRSSTRWRPPATRSSTWSSRPARGWAASSSAGSSRPRSPAPPSASTPSMSRT